MAEHADILITHAHLFTLQGEGVGYVADGAVGHHARRGSGRDSLDAAGAVPLLSSHHPSGGAGWDPPQRPGSAQGRHYHIC